MLERQIRDSRAIDTEGLCITPGSQVWALRCDAHVLDDSGNLIDACALATIAAILHFRRAEISTQDGKTVIHSYAERAPVPLAIHHIPVCVSFALYHPLKAAGGNSGARAPKRTAIEAMAPGQGGIGSLIDDVVDAGDEVVVLDPNDRELLVSDGSLSFVMNAHKELCGIHKLGGCPIDSTALMQCAKVAGLRAVEIIEQLKAALGAAEAADIEKYRGRLAAAAGLAEKAGIDLLEPDQEMHHAAREDARTLIASSIASVITTEIEQMSSSHRADTSLRSNKLDVDAVMEMDFLSPS
jgi:exosome complex RNA-binding protein Rrp42 (RNase PH superfamily)